MTDKLLISFESTGKSFPGNRMFVRCDVEGNAELLAGMLRGALSDHPELIALFLFGCAAALRDRKHTIKHCEAVFSDALKASGL